MAHSARPAARTTGHPAGRTTGHPAARTTGHPAAPAAAHADGLAGAPVPWGRLRKVLVVRLDNLGDVVLTGPLLRSVRAALEPGARLDLLASPGGSLAGPLLPWVDDVLVHRAVWQDASAAGLTRPPDPAAELALVERLRQGWGPYDAVIISTSFSQSPWPAAYAAYLAGVPIRVGQSGEFGGSLLTHWVQPAPDDLVAHQVDRSLRLAAAAGIAPQGTHLELAAPERPPPVPGPYVLVAPGASAPARRYPAFAEVVARLRAEGLRVLVVGSGREQALVSAVSGGVDGLAGALDVPSLAAAVAAARVVVTNNSACLHLADAYGTPQVALFAGTETVSQYAPRSGCATVLRRPTRCTPCRAFVCPYSQECLDVAPSDVVAAVLATAVDRTPA